MCRSGNISPAVMWGPGSKHKLSGLLVDALTDEAIMLALASIQSLSILNLEEIGPF